MSKIVDFLRESKIELKKVTWPTKQEVIKYTLIVIIFSLITALFLGGLDFVFSFILNKFIF